jgi:pyrroloquinoline quinone biosynthesis protein B
MLSLIVLGSAAGGGVPQWNCGCDICRAARSRPALQNGQASIAVSVDGAHWFLVNASPDLRSQLIATPQLFPKEGAVRHSPIAGVILTNAEVDAIAGLLSLREGAVFSIHAHPRVLDTLAANSVFDVLDPTRVPRIPVAEGVPFEPRLADGSPSGLLVEAFNVPGKVALYLEGRGERTEGDTVGLTLTDIASGQTAHVLTACAAMTPQLAERLRGSDLVFFDGTLWRDDEMIRAGLAEKTGQRMGHMSMSGADGAIAALAPLGIRQKVFIHINNSNPALLPESPERRAVEAAGWTVPEPGRVFSL